MALKESKIISLLKDIKKTLEAIEERGRPGEITQTIVTVHRSEDSEEKVAEEALDALRWKLQQGSGHPEPPAEEESPFTKPETKEFMDDIIHRVEDAPEGEAVKVHTGKKSHFDTIDAKDVEAITHNVAFNGIVFEPVYKTNRENGWVTLTGMTGATLRVDAYRKVLVRFND